jgi:hypothetical protein
VHLPVADLDLDVVRITKHEQSGTVRIVDGALTASACHRAASQLIDVVSGRDGEADMIQAGSAFVEGLPGIVRVLAEAHAQSARMDDVDPLKIGTGVEPVAANLETKHIRVPPGADVAVGHRQIKVGQTAERTR